MHLLEGKTVGPLRETSPLLDDMKRAMKYDSLAHFLDMNDVPHSLLSELCATRRAVSSLKNLLQGLWFGANIEQKGEYDYTQIN